MYTNCMLYIRTSTGMKSVSVPEEVFEALFNASKDSSWVELSAFATDSNGTVDVAITGEFGP